MQVEKIRIQIQPMHELLQKHYEMSGSVVGADLIPRKLGVAYSRTFICQKVDRYKLGEAQYQKEGFICYSDNLS
jgi:hypothetical protein